MDGLTFQALLTAAGAGIAAGIVTAVVSLLKTSLPIVKDWNGAAMAFALSFALYVLAAIATNVASLDAGLGVFVAWLTCASTAVGLHEVAVKPIVSRAQSDRVISPVVDRMSKEK